MKELGPIAGIDHKNTMTEISHAEGRDYQGITKIIMKESIIIHFRTMEIRENIESYKDKYREENHKYKRRSRDYYYEDVYEDRHDRDKYKHQYRNESYNLGKDRSREEQHECNARKTPYFSKLELINSTI